MFGVYRQTLLIRVVPTGGISFFSLSYIYDKLSQIQDVMGKVAKILPPEQLAIAQQNNIPITTVYKRIQAGWDMEKAISQPPRQRKNIKDRDKDGSFTSATGIKKVKTRSFALPSNWDEVLDKEIEASGMTQAEYIEKLVINKLKRSKYRDK